MNTRIKKIGFEIEGEFTQRFISLLNNPTFGTIKEDRSVHACKNDSMPDHNKALRRQHRTKKTLEKLEPYEYASIPFETIQQATDMLDMFERAWKTGQYHHNNSAGFHVHVSFVPKLPCEIMSREFATYFTKAMQKQLPQEYETRKDNYYCKARARYTDDKIRTDSRYTAINMYPAFRAHGTIEFRIFPTAQPKKMKQYLLFTIGTIKAYLQLCKTQGIKRRLCVPCDDALTPLTETITETCFLPNCSANNGSAPLIVNI